MGGRSAGSPFRAQRPVDQSGGVAEGELAAMPSSVWSGSRRPPPRRSGSSPQAPAPPPASCTPVLLAITVAALVAACAVAAAGRLTLHESGSTGLRSRDVSPDARSSAATRAATGAARRSSTIQCQPQMSASVDPVLGSVEGTLRTPGVCGLGRDRRRPRGQRLSGQHGAAQRRAACPSDLGALVRASEGAHRGAAPSGSVARRARDARRHGPTDEPWPRDVESL